MYTQIDKYLLVMDPLTGFGFWNLTGKWVQRKFCNIIYVSGRPNPAELNNTKLNLKVDENKGCPPVWYFQGFSGPIWSTTDINYLTKFALNPFPS